MVGERPQDAEGKGCRNVCQSDLKQLTRAPVREAGQSGTWTAGASHSGPRCAGIQPRVPFKCTIKCGNHVFSKVLLEHSLDKGMGGEGKGEAGHPTTAPRRVARGRGDGWAESGEQATPPHLSPRALLAGTAQGCRRRLRCSHPAGTWGAGASSLRQPWPQGHQLSPEVTRGSAASTLTVVPMGGMFAVLLGRCRISQLPAEKNRGSGPSLWPGVLPSPALVSNGLEQGPGQAGSGEKCARGVPGSGEFDEEAKAGIWGNSSRRSDTWREIKEQWWAVGTRRLRGRGVCVCVCVTHPSWCQGLGGPGKDLASAWVTGCICAALFLFPA